MNHDTSLNVLIVDDKKENRDLLYILLSEHFKEKVSCICVESGIRALQTVLEEDIDLILLDIQMPDMDGFKVAKLLHAQNETHSTPIIFISAHYTDERYTQLGFSHGAIDFLAKPINEVQLINKVNLFVSLKEKSREIVEKEEEEYAIIEHMNDGLINLKFSAEHNDFKILHANIAFCTMFHKEHETIKNKYMTTIFENTRESNIFDFIFNVYTTSNEAHLEQQFYQNRSTDASWYKLFAYKLKNNNVIVIVSDISAQVIFNEKLERNRVYLQNILDAQNNLILIADEEKFLYCNSAFTNFFNIPSLYTLEYDKFLSFIETTDASTALNPNNYVTTSQWIKKLYAYKKSIKITMLKNTIKQTFSLKIETIVFLKQVHYILIFTNIDKLENERHKLEIMATTDTLTKISNRFKFNLILEDKLNIVKRNKDIKLSLIMFDLDHFKHVNDTFGHDVGDKVLINTVLNVSQNIRESDLFARWGGEEFIIICSDTTLKNTLNLAEKLRSSIENINDKNIPHITASFGVTTYLQNETSTTLLKRLDDALYISKKRGRNCITSL